MRYTKIDTAAPKKRAVDHRRIAIEPADGGGFDIAVLGTYGNMYGIKPTLDEAMDAAKSWMQECEDVLAWMEDL